MAIEWIKYLRARMARFIKAIWLIKNECGVTSRATSRDIDLTASWKFASALIKIIRTIQMISHAYFLKDRGSDDEIVK